MSEVEAEAVPPEDQREDEGGPNAGPSGQKRPAYDDLDDPEVGGTMAPQKKLCRFYFLDECSRADQCYFMHADFPCKFYYFGYECRDGKQCRLRHGKALDEEMKGILWRHVTTAPANLMQRFPCFPNALLRRNFEERHQELLLMEQEGLLDEELEEELGEDISDTLLGEVIKTVAINQMIDDQLGDLGELGGVITAEQIGALAKVGVKTKEQLFQMGASSLMELGFDYEALIDIGNLKESHRKQSMYEKDKSEGEAPSGDSSAIDVFDTALDLSQPAVSTVPVLSDQELLSILNDERELAEVARDDSHNSSVATTIEGSFTTDFSDTSGSAEKAQNGHGDRLTKLNTTVASDVSSDGEDKLQFLLYAAVKEKENDPQARESTARTVEQMCKLDSLIADARPELNISFGSDSENSQSGFRLPFKSIIDKYTPATEIDACSGKVVAYKLVPIDVPKPNFESLRRSFVTEPTFSADPRLQLMFNIGPTEVRPVTNGDAFVIRDPRLKRAIEVATANGGQKFDEETTLT